MPKFVNLLCQVVSGIAIFVGAIGLVGLGVSGENRVSSAFMIGGAVLVWMLAYATRRMLVRHQQQSWTKRK